MLFYISWEGSTSFLLDYYTNSMKQSYMIGCIPPDISMVIKIWPEMVTIKGHVSGFISFVLIKVSSHLKHEF